MKYLIVKDGKYLSVNQKWTDNKEFAYVYDKQEAEHIAEIKNAKIKGWK